MDLISFALAKKALDATTEGLEISSVEIDNGELKITLSNGKEFNAGKIPTADLEAYEELREQLKTLENSLVKTDNGILTNATITLANDPTEDMDAVTKKYVDSKANDMQAALKDYTDSKDLKIHIRDNKSEFPSVGLPNVLYKAKAEGKTYIWTVSGYEVLCETQSSEIGNIKLINGGNSNGR